MSLRRFVYLRAAFAVVAAVVSKAERREAKMVSVIMVKSAKNDSLLLVVGGCACGCVRRSTGDF
jgi:hypothetical protein